MFFGSAISCGRDDKGVDAFTDEVAYYVCRNKVHVGDPEGIKVGELIPLEGAVGVSTDGGCSIMEDGKP